jgi:hypothetical protein
VFGLGIIFLLSFLIIAAILFIFIGIPLLIVKQSGTHVSFDASLPEAHYAKDARKLVQVINETLKTSPISAEQKSEVQKQMKEVTANVDRALNKLERLRKVKKIAKRNEDASNSAQVLGEIRVMEQKIRDELLKTHEVLLSMPITLMKVDTARGDRDLDRAIDNLGNTNHRLNDLASGYDDLRSNNSYGYP